MTEFYWSAGMRNGIDLRRLPPPRSLEKMGTYPISRKLDTSPLFGYGVASGGSFPPEM
jgi:hypothetical protein